MARVEISSKSYKGTLNIHLKNPHTIDGETVHNAYIIQNETTMADWLEGHPTMFKVLKGVPNTNIRNPKVDTLEFRGNGGRAYKCSADIDFEGVTYRIRFDLRDYNLIEILNLYGCDEGFRLRNKYVFLHLGGNTLYLCPEDMNFENYRKSQEIAINMEKKNLSIENSRPIKKKDLEFGKVFYKKENGAEMIFLGRYYTHHIDKRTAYYIHDYVQKIDEYLLFGKVSDLEGIETLAEFRDKFEELAEQKSIFTMKQSSVLINDGDDRKFVDYILSENDIVDLVETTQVLFTHKIRIPQNLLDVGLKFTWFGEAITCINNTQFYKNTLASHKELSTTDLLKNEYDYYKEKLMENFEHWSEGYSTTHGYANTNLGVFIKAFIQYYNAKFLRKIYANKKQIKSVSLKVNSPIFDEFIEDLIQVISAYNMTFIFSMSTTNYELRNTRVNSLATELIVFDNIESITKNLLNNFIRKNYSARMEHLLIEKDTHYSLYIFRKMGSVAEYNSYVGLYKSEDNVQSKNILLSANIKYIIPKTADMNLRELVRFIEE